MRLILLLLLSVPASGWPQIGASRSQRALFGDLAVEARLDTNGLFRVGLADSAHTIELDLLQRDVHRWADSAARILVAPGRRRVTRWTAHLEEAGIAAGSMTLMRRDSGGRSAYSLFASDKDFVDTRTPLTPVEARALVRLVQRALGPSAAPPGRRQRRS